MGRYAHSSWIEPYSKEDIESTEYQLEELGITHLKNRSIFEISGGEYQRVMIARSLAQSTEILLLDEPFTHLDITSQHSLLALIQKIAKQKNSTVLMSLHDINAAPLFSDKTILLREGNLVCFDKTSVIFSENYLSKAYNTEFGFFKHPYYNVMQSYITSAV
jgi:iron complex transport system ATP-binding protein